MEQNINQLRQEFATKKKELSILRFRLNQQNKEKEEAYRAIRSSRDKVKARTSQIKTLKEERDMLTKDVRNLKKERNKLNEAVKKESSVKRELDEKKKDLQGKIDNKETPSMLKKQIEELEFKLETEAIQYNKEKEFRKTLKDLQSRYRKVADAEELWKKVNSASTNLPQVRRDAQDSHKSVQVKADASQQKHEEMLNLYKQIKQFREEEKPNAHKYIELKKAYEATQIELTEVQKRVDELSKLFKDDSEQNYKAKAHKKTEEVKEKMRKGKKLSTEDILAFQAMKD
ncbi:hypothetical protein COV12_02185 [Candidatus Woesearchaeota archaeon CG10_big_fil_rev_8_21_14_0_10_32_24]|nr:MAG: hypothetical protein COV12_02185 [Candidatus Woesearchaeota archaeon CG10_big_fil_rev_8_21_14_0_10_32_24]